MTEYDDNIMKGIQDWSAPYRFIIGRKSRWDSKVEVMLWTPQPALAYEAYMRVRDNEAFSVGAIMYDYFLHDSFHKDAEVFCRNAFESAEEIDEL